MAFINLTQALTEPELLNEQGFQSLQLSDFIATAKDEANGSATWSKWANVASEHKFQDANLRIDIAGAISAGFATT